MQKNASIAVELSLGESRGRVNSFAQKDLV